MSSMPAAPQPIRDDFNEILDPDPKTETCLFCSRKYREKDLGEYEIGFKYQGQRDATRGYQICIECKNREQNRIQEMVTRTWMKIKARAEKPCCGGG